ncbi:MAG: DUF2127 domain-containing protein [Leucobacter sp.]
MSADRRHTTLDLLFKISVLFKAVDGVLELLSGLSLLFVTPRDIRSWLTHISDYYVGRHENSLILRWIEHSADALNTSATTFAAAYLMVYGVVKIGLAWAVLRGKTWAYPWLIAVLVAFIGYQCYDMVVHFTWAMLVLTLFDVVLAALVFREWRLHRRDAQA